MIEYNFDLYPGNNLSLDFAVTASGAPINLLGYTLSGFARYRYSDTGYALNLLPQITSATGGRFSVFLNSTQTTGVKVGKMYYNINRYMGTYTDGLVGGKVTVYPFITNTVVMANAPVDTIHQATMGVFDTIVVNNLIITGSLGKSSLFALESITENGSTYTATINQDTNQERSVISSAQD